MTNNFCEKLSEHEKLMYELNEKNKNKKQTGNMTQLVSPLNDLIEFNPFQYIPYVKLKNQIKHPKKVYIADEVGAGKTIETGIILSELIYNGEFKQTEQKCLIICPNLLCRKWSYTLKSLFGINSVIIHSLNEVLNGINIVSFDTVSTSDEVTLKEINILIIDEAHNASGDRFKKIMTIRNQVCTKSGYVLLLSATPTSGKKKDSKNQLEILFGGSIDETIKKDFFKNAGDNEYLCKNRKCYMRYAFSTNNKNVNVTTEIENHYIKNEILKDFIEKLEKHFLGKNTLMLFPGINAIMSSPAAAEVYFSKLLGKSNEEFFEYLQNSSQTLYDEDDESEDEFEEGFEDDESEDEFEEGFENEFKEFTIADVDEIRNEIRNEISEMNSTIKRIKNNSKKEDDKLKKLIEIIEKNKSKFNDKKDGESRFYGHIIVFTDKLSTAKYLEDNLKNEYNNVFRVTGELFESEKLNRLQQYKNVTEDISILIITNVACEGQDMDFGNTIINFDLDYNPVRLEQRRGRIDRFKVNKNTIFIHNFAVEGFDCKLDDSKAESNQYSKVKIIHNKIKNIEKSTGVFYEILKSRKNQNNGNIKMDEVVNEVYKNVYNLITIDDNIPSTMEDLKEKMVKGILDVYGGSEKTYRNVYELVNEMMKKEGLIISPMQDEKIIIEVDKKNQEFLNNIYHGGTMISHIINGGK